MPNGPLAWNITGSFFWMALAKIKDIFNWSTNWEIGNGDSINFWYDSWDGPPILTFFEQVRRPQKPVLALNQAVNLLEEVAPEMVPQFGEGPDRIRWRWSSSGEYTSNSIYKLLVSGGKIFSAFSRVWSAKVPPTVRVFGYLLLRGKLLTRDVLIRRNVQCNSQCEMCLTGRGETINHLIIGCHYAKRVWRACQRNLRIRLLPLTLEQRPVRASIQEIWCEVVQGRAHLNANEIQEWMCRVLGIAWFIWRQRNDTIFRGKTVPPEILAQKAIQEGSLWLRVC